MIEKNPWMNHPEMTKRCYETVLKLHQFWWNRNEVSQCYIYINHGSTMQPLQMALCLCKDLQDRNGLTDLESDMIYGICPQ